jgi:type 1 glutamine amidotransferase
MPVASCKGGVKFKVHVADKTHPITQGLKDYDLFDETYCGRTFRPDIHVLLTTDELSSDKPISWVKTFKKSRVFYIQSGHDENAYRNRNYRTLVIRAIRWTADQLP